MLVLVCGYGALCTPLCPLCFSLLPSLVEVVINFLFYFLSSCLLFLVSSIIVLIHLAVSHHSPVSMSLMSHSHLQSCLPLFLQFLSFPVSFLEFGVIPLVYPSWSLVFLDLKFHRIEG